MTITIAHQKRKWQWDKNRAANGFPAWESDKGQPVFSKRLVATLDKKLAQSRRHNTTTIARRFSAEDWGWLCTKSKFLEVLATDELAAAEAVAWELLNERRGL